MGSTVQTTDNRDDLERVQGRIAFVRRTPAEKAPEVTASKGYTEPMVSYDVTIRNARPIVGDLSLDREGFSLIQHRTSCANERDPEIMRERYLDEMIPFIKNYFNASRVVARRQAVVIRDTGETSSSTPPGEENRQLVNTNVAGFAHIDYSPIAAPMLAALANQQQGIPIQAYSRLMLIQAWRALSPPPQDLALAFCDGTSVLDTDLVNTNFENYGVRHGSWLVHHNPSHRWYYFPQMKPDEFILFKGYDSEDGFNPRSAHAAFDNRRAYPDAKPRKSIEARFFVYFD
ncbi:CmcJ/NvfI family oxidoreductase [Bradyrhizobium sp. 5.13L]